MLRKSASGPRANGSEIAKAGEAARSAAIAPSRAKMRIMRHAPAARVLPGRSARVVEGECGRNGDGGLFTKALVRAARRQRIRLGAAIAAPSLSIPLRGFGGTRADGTASSLA